MDSVLFLPAWLQLVVVLLVFCVPSVVGLYLVRRLVPLERLRENHEVAGFTFGVLGAFYGLLLAFVIVAAWQRYEYANQEMQIEAVSLAELYRLGSDLGEPARTQLQQGVRHYIGNLIDNEWPEMVRGSYRFDRDREISLDMWHVVSSYHPRSPIEQIIVSKCFDQLDQITDAASVRSLYYTESLPPFVWVVIWVGCIIVIGFSYFFALEAFRPQALMVGVFAGLLGLTILAIIDLAHPYAGTQTVPITPMRNALAQIDRIDQVIALSHRTHPAATRALTALRR